MDTCCIAALGVVDNQVRTLTLGLNLTVVGHFRSEGPAAGSIECTVAEVFGCGAIEDSSLLERLVEHFVLRVASVVEIGDERILRT